MTQEQIKTLAKYLGGGQQAKFSIYLEMGGLQRGDANDFFKLRDVFGVESYASVEAAEKQIAKAIAKKAAA